MAFTGVTLMSLMSPTFSLAAMQTSVSRMSFLMLYPMARTYISSLVMPIAPITGVA